ncbi:MAG: type II secretion system protein [Candidatus Paceibacterota bacterium]|jgi:type II secretory pathway pseudopilin PulG
MRNRSSFTLIELLIVIGILAVLVAAIVITLNPAQLLAQAQDGKRMQDFSTLGSALQMFVVQGGTNLGSTNTIYISIPDSSATCTNLGLPLAPLDKVYACAPTSTYLKTDGTGWIPVNFSTMIGTPLLSSLPVDPTNATSSGNYYIYVTDGSGRWEFDARLVSLKYGYGAGNISAKTAQDGGNNDYLYEAGSKLDLLLDNENLLQDGDMETSTMSYWSPYGTPSVLEKVSSGCTSGSYCMHVVGNDTGYEGFGKFSISPPLFPQSRKVFIEMAYRVAPSLALGWECYCTNLGCCAATLFNNATSTAWEKKKTIADVSTSLGVSSILFADPNLAPASEYWIDDAIVRPVY